MPTSHTPTPWTSRYSNIEAGKLLIGTLSSGLKAPTPSEAEANAAFIVKAVNAHNDLVDALISALPCLEDALEYGDYSKDSISESIEKVRVALAKSGEA